MYRLTSTPSNVQPNFNVCPTDPVDVVLSRDGTRVLSSMRWGLIPGWWKKPLKEMRMATFNARAESITEKPTFRDSFLRRRCLMPISGYYEWLTLADGKKQPFYFTRTDGKVMTIAAVHDRWVNPETQEAVRSCAMVIGQANRLVSDIHDRMPVILESENFAQWEQGDPKDAAALMKPMPEDALQRHAVSMRVNSSKTSGDDPTLVEAISS